MGALIYGIPVGLASFAEELGAFSVHPSLEFIDQRLVDDAHSRKLKVYAYTANHHDDIARAHALGVEGVFTNFPEKVLDNYSQGNETNIWR